MSPARQCHEPREESTESPGRAREVIPHPYADDFQILIFRSSIQFLLYHFIIPDTPNLAPVVCPSLSQLKLQHLPCCECQKCEFPFTYPSLQPFELRINFQICHCCFPLQPPSRPQACLASPLPWSTPWRPCGFPPHTPISPARASPPFRAQF